MEVIRFEQNVRESNFDAGRDPLRREPCLNDNPGGSPALYSAGVPPAPDVSATGAKTPVPGNLSPSPSQCSGGGPRRGPPARLISNRPI